MTSATTGSGTDTVPEIDEQELADLRVAVLELCADHGNLAPARAMETSGLDHDPVLWEALGRQMGLAGVGLPEEHGGLGGLRAVVTVAAALGTCLAPVPFWSSTVLAGQVLASLDPAGLPDGDLPGRLMSEVADGTPVAAAVADSDGRFDPGTLPVLAEHLDGSWQLGGTAHFVAGGASARHLLVVACGPEGPDLFLVDPTADGVRVELAPSLDLSRPLSRLVLAGAGSTPVTSGGSAAPAVQRGVDVALVALAAEQAAGAQRVLDMTVEYVKVRRQFSRPIGGFQVIKHRLVDLLALVEFAHSAVDRALLAEDGREPGALAEAAAVAASWCGDVYRDVCADAVQLHGGIGFTWEHDAHLYFRRAHADAVLLGDPDTHRERLAALLGW